MENATSTQSDWLKNQLETPQNSWTKDYLPHRARALGRGVKWPFAQVWNAGSRFFGDHPDIRKFLSSVVIIGAVVGGSFLISAAPGLINTRFVQSILNSPVVQVGKDVFLWGKGVVGQVWQDLPEMAAVVFGIGALLILTDPSPRLFSSTESTIVGLGVFIAGMGVVSLFVS